MLRIRQRFMKLTLPACILGAGILPGTCGMQIRDAAVGGFASFVGDAVDAVLTTLVPLETLLGAA